MADLSFTEREQLEKLFGMSSGYVLHFTNKTFRQFIRNSVSRDIYAAAYDYGSGSKANRLRKFWNVERNQVVGKLLSDLLEAARLNPSPWQERDEALLAYCQKIADRLKVDTPLESPVFTEDKYDGEGFSLLEKSIRASIEANEPETGLDRLHTYVTKFLRSVCEARGIAVLRNKPLHSLMGEYVKSVKKEGWIETTMAERVLKSSISTLESFNTVRNDHSLAHDNTVLGYEEALLIFNHVVGAVNFVRHLEEKLKLESVGSQGDDDDDVPF